MKNYLSHTLPNGLRIVHKPIDGNVSYCGLIVGTGTRDERKNELGMAHFIEHMLFKGTEKRKAFHINNRMENVGGELNAYTNKEETVIYSIFLEEHFQRALELLSDITFHSVFPQHEIDKEVDVIIDEIHSYEDSPSELIYDEFEDIIFANTQLGHNILGEPELLETFNTIKAKEFHSRNYQTQNAVLFSLGNTDFRKIVRYAEKYLSDITTLSSAINRAKLSTNIERNRIEKKDKNTAQAHALIGSYAYSFHDPKRRTLALLNNILGGPSMNSRLNTLLREKHGYVYNVESNVTSYSDTGVFSIYFGSDKRNLDKCINLINKELKRFRDLKLTTLQLTAAKKQLIGQIGVANDNRENIFLSLGKSFLRYDHFDTLTESFTKIDAITSDQLLDVANEVLDEKRLFSLIYN